MALYGSYDMSDFPGMEQVDAQKVRLLDAPIQGGYMGGKRKSERYE